MHRLPRFFNASQVFLVLALVGSFCALHCANTPQVVTFDQQQLMGRFVAQLSAHTLTKEGLREKTDRFSLALKTSLNAYAKTHRVLVLKSSDVLAGERDITSCIEQDIARLMRKPL